jgi:hypothetical protein
MGKYFSRKPPERTWDSIIREINAKVNGRVSSSDPKEQNKCPDYLQDWIEQNQTSPAK